MEFLKNLAALLKVKTIVTLVVIAVFATLALNGRIGADNAMIIISMVVSFYFGTQHQKVTPATVPTTVYTNPVAVIPEQATPVTASVDNATYSKIRPNSK